MLPSILNHSVFYSMTAVANPTTFADLFQDTPKDTFGMLAAADKRAAYEKIYAHFDVNDDNGIVPGAVLILTEITHLFEAEPIGGIVFFLQTDKGHRLKIVHGLRKYQSGTSVTTSNARHEFACFGET